MKLTIFLLVFLTVLVLIHVLFYKSTGRLFLKKSKPRLKKILLYSDIALTFIVLLFLFFFFNEIRRAPDFTRFTNAFYMISIFMLIFIPKINYLLFLGINHLIRFSVNIFRKRKTQFNFITFFGLALSIAIFIIMLQGTLFGKEDFTVKNTTIQSNKLPSSFNTLKIIQLSDIHIGSFCGDTASISDAVQMINQLNPDIVLLTGDLVNNYAEEADAFDMVFNKIHAKIGKYAVLGNHDFGDYTVWRTPKTKDINLNDIIKHYKSMGFTLLRNEHIYIKNNTDSIAIAGVDSWGLPPFKQYGNIETALKNIPENMFTIVLSHDPSYWNTKIKHLSNADITFSGHTHGMQLGFENFGLKWSPVKYRYPQWGGLYQHQSNYLYVNRGLGVIGFIGRIGMPPEITLIEIQRQ